jgi:hypothetical protein
MFLYRAKDAVKVHDDGHQGARVKKKPKKAFAPRAMGTDRLNVVMRRGSSVYVVIGE